jgi:aminoglycoside phosphotransferase (APT) family kinase protein
LPGAGGGGRNCIMGTSVEDARRAVEAHLPERVVGRVVLLGEGYDHVAYEVDGDLIVRFAKEARDLERDGALLTGVARVAPVPTPVPVFVDAEHGCLAYRKLVGVPLLELADPRAVRSVLGTVAGFLAALHATPVEDFADLVEVDHFSTAEWLDEAAEQFAGIAGDVDPALVPAIGEFLAAPPPDGPDLGALVFSHNDLGAEHVLFDPSTGAVTGVIDWSDAAIVDPAYDYGLLYRDLGTVALEYCPAPLRERAVFYARCTVFEDFAYGQESGLDAYQRESRAALEHLFRRA